MNVHGDPLFNMFFGCFGVMGLGDESTCLYTMELPKDWRPLLFLCHHTADVKRVIPHKTNIELRHCCGSLSGEHVSRCCLLVGVSSDKCSEVESFDLHKLFQAIDG